MGGDRPGPGSARLRVGPRLPAERDLAPLPRPRQALRVPRREVRHQLEALAPSPRPPTPISRIICTTPPKLTPNTNNTNQRRRGLPTRAPEAREERLGRLLPLNGPPCTLRCPC